MNQQAAAVENEDTLSAEDAQTLWDTESLIAAGGTPAVTEAPAAAAATTVDKPAAKPAAASTVNEWEGVPEPVRRNIEAINESVRKITADVSTTVGRVGSMQREMQAFRSVAASVPASGDKPSNAQINAAAADPAKWAKFKDDYPEIAEAMDLRLQGLQPPAKPAAVEVPPGKVDLTPIESRLQQTEQNNATLAEDNAKLRVEVKHQGWEDTVRTPEFDGWLKKQAPDIRALADSSKPADAIRMLDRYVKDNDDATKAAALTGNRKDRLQRNVAITNTARTPQKSDDDLTAKEIWDQEAAKLDKAGAR